MPEAWPPLIAALRKPQAWPHAVERIDVVETHISWVLLAGEYAYKIKKPVDLGFVDFSTADKRHRACLDELRLNRRFAPDLYLDVVPIAGTPASPCVGGSGTAFEHAVRMRRFAQEQQLDRQLDAGRLDESDMDALAEVIAGFHERAPRSDAGSPYGLPDRIGRDALDSIAALQAGVHGELRDRVDRLADWTRHQNGALAARMCDRHDAGFVREVHGDLHLANLVRLDSGIVPFDCIEFDAALRWNDTISDLAFLTMDLRMRRRADLAYRVLNRCLECSGDYAAVRLLHYYECYRALVRAKIALIRRDSAAPGELRRAHDRQLAGYACLAEELATTDRGAIVLMHGLSGSGKTWLSTSLMTALPAVRIRSDVERKRLHGLTAGERSDSSPGGGIYRDADTHATYGRLHDLARDVVGGGETAIVDATFLQRTHRQRLRALAHELQRPFAIVDCRCPVDVLRSRIALRAAQGADASEATADVLDRQLQSAEPFDADETARVIDVPVERDTDVAAVALRLRALLLPSGTAHR